MTAPPASTSQFLLLPDRLCYRRSASAEDRGEETKYLPLDQCPIRAQPVGYRMRNRGPGDPTPVGEAPSTATSVADADADRARRRGSVPVGREKPGPAIQYADHALFRRAGAPRGVGGGGDEPFPLDASGVSAGGGGGGARSGHRDGLPCRTRLQRPLRVSHLLPAGRGQARDRKKRSGRGTGGEGDRDRGRGGEGQRERGRGTAGERGRERGRGGAPLRTPNRDHSRPPSRTAFAGTLRRSGCGIFTRRGAAALCTR